MNSGAAREVDVAKAASKKRATKKRAVKAKAAAKASNKNDDIGEEKRLKMGAPAGGPASGAAGARLVLPKHD